MNGRLKEGTALVFGRPAAESGKRTSKQALRIRLYLMLLAMDIIALCAGFAAANLARFGDVFAARGMEACQALLPLYILCAFNGRGYSIEVLTNGRLSLKRAMTALIIAVAGMSIIIFYIRAGDDFSRSVLAVGVAFSTMLLMIGRKFTHRYAQRLIGDSPLSEVIIRDGATLPVRSRARLIDAQTLGLEPDLNDPAMLDRLGSLIDRADRVLVSCPPERRADWATALKGMNVTGELFASELDGLGVIGTGRYGGTPTMQVATGPLGLRDRILKRGLDLAVASIALVLLSPLLAAIATAIKLDSPGPALFRQQRIGRDNRLFYMYKFRSMRIERSDATGSQLTAKEDDRVTRIGHFIRRTSIDELPQILNVLLGNMSLVGPRPHATGALAGDALYWEVDGRYWHRHAVKPGMTGLAQIRGFRGTTFERSDLVNRLQADLDYVSGWTIWRDLSILLATTRVLVHRNAF